MELNQLKSLLLDLISPARHVKADALTSLSEAELADFQAMARQHRLEPLLFWSLTHEKRDCVQPETLKARLAACFKQASIRTLQQQRELLLTHRILAAANIPHIALKGAFLAFHAYPHPAMRPLRDLDILVPKEQALMAYQTLLDEGLQRVEAYPGDPKATLAVGHHLPPLQSPSGTVYIEVHGQLFHPEKNRDSTPDLSEAQYFWKRIRTIPVAGNEIAYESSTDLLLHMIVHAVYDHCFNNGPLLLSDLAYLLRTQEIDWKLFWRLAHDFDRTRGCLLALSLAEHYWGKLPIDWPESITPEITEMPLSEAALMMLRDFEARADVTFGNEVAAQASIFKKLGVLLRKVFPPKSKIAALYPVSPDSLKIYFYYPAKWWFLLTDRLPNYLRSLSDDGLREEVKSVGVLEQWLQSKSHDRNSQSA